MPSPNSQRGIVLLISIVMAVVTVMFVGAALALGPANLAVGQKVIDLAEASRAAESGLQYALTQLRRDPDWRGQANKVTVNLPDAYIVEEQGNVVGLLATRDGHWSQFRLRFNYQDGAPDREGLADPTAAMRVDHPYLSVNNLKGSWPAPVPRADGPGYSVTASSLIAHNAPLWGVSLVVEGKAGPGVAHLSPANPNPPLNGPVSRVAIEGLYQVPSAGDQFQDSAAMAARGFAATLRNGGQNVSFQAKAGGRTARIRSKSEVSVRGGDVAANLVSKAGEVTSGSGTLSALFNAAQIGVRQEKPVDPFYQLAWSDVKTAPASGATMPAGTYVWWQDGLHYYDMPYGEYVLFIKNHPTDPGVPPSLPAQIKMPPGPKKTLQLEGSVYVQATSNTRDFALVTRQGAPEDPPPPGPAGAVDVVAQTIVSNGYDQRFFQDYNFASGNLTLKDSLNNPMFGATWSNAMNNATYSFQFQGYGEYTKVDLFRYLINPALYPGCTVVPGSTFLNNNTNASTVAGNLNIDTTLGPGQIRPPGVSDSLTAADVEVVFKGQSSPVTLSGEGNIRLTGAVRGSGGSITAGGDIRVVGLGADFSAGPNSPDGVNMYAKGDVVFSTLQEVPTGLQYADVHLKGIVYSWGDFVAKLGNNQLGAWGRLRLDGMLVAYGGDPSKDAPGQNGLGLVSILAEKVDLTFDPSYLASLSANLPAKYKLQLTSWSDRLP